MFRNFKESFRNLSWSGFISVLCAIAAAVAFVFFTFEAAVVFILFGIYFVLVSFRDE